MSEKGGGFGDFLTGAILGGLVGYLAAMLSAPRAGDETRRMLAERSMELRDRATDTVQTTLDKTGKLVSEGRDKVTSTVSDTVDRTKERVSDLTNRGSDVVREKREQASDTMRSAADKIDPDSGPISSSF